MVLVKKNSRRASRVLRGALALGALLIIGAAVLRAFREVRAEHACVGDVSACAAKCRDRKDRACQMLAERCRREDRKACEALERKLGAPW